MGWNISGGVLLFSNISILTQISLADRIKPISTREISYKNKNIRMFLQKLFLHNVHFVAHKSEL